jgi:tetratricopeptide (TPR) repeat protein
MMTRMPIHRHLPRALLSVSLAACLMLPLAHAAAQDQSPQQLYEAGQDEAVFARVEAERAQGQEALETTFLAAQAARRLNQAQRAVDEYQRIAASENPAWAALGRSGAALESGNLDEARAQAAEAVALEANLGYAHYQLGLVHARGNNAEAAGQAFARAAELMPSFAYAHYHAGMAFQRARNVNRMATHFEQFLQLAPNAPERTQVAVIMRSIRG